LHETSPFEDNHVLQHSRERHFERLGKFAHGSLTRIKTAENSTPRRIAQCLEYPIKVSR
jgi:hypothetical protein